MPSSTIAEPNSGMAALPMAITGTLFGTTAGATSLAARVLGAESEIYPSLVVSAHRSHASSAQE